MTVARAATVEIQPSADASRGLVVFDAPQKQGNGGLDGASRLNRDTMLWSAPDVPVDVEIGRSKTTADARARDQINNNGYMSGFVETYRDSVVGSEFRLMAKPNFKVLGLDEVWADEFKEYIEARWQLYAESDDCWADAARRMTATEIVRLNVGMYCSSGEYLVASEWLKDRQRPYKTAFNSLDPRRLCNPRDGMDTRYLRRGIVIDEFGAPQGYYLRTAHKRSPYREDTLARWDLVPARKPWGRKLVFHCADIRNPEQTRAVSRLVTVMKEMRMTEKFQDIVLQNAIVNATYAAAIESELPRDIVFAQLGEMGSPGNAGSPIGAGPLIDYIKTFLAGAADFHDNSKNLALDGVKIPHLFPGTKLNLQPAGNPGGVGTNFEASFLRHISRALGISYEEFSGNFSDTNYSSARAAIATTERSTRAVKKQAADRLAQSMYTNWLEEELNRPGSEVPLPSNAPNFYEGMNRAAYSQSKWIGSARGQIDEVKETQAAGMRIGLGISTVEDEASRLGKDWREIAAQRKRERDLNDLYGIEQPSTDTTRQNSFEDKTDDSNK